MPKLNIINFSQLVPVQTEAKKTHCICAKLLREDETDRCYLCTSSGFITYLETINYLRHSKLAIIKFSEIETLEFKYYFDSSLFCKNCKMEMDFEEEVLYDGEECCRACRQTEKIEPELLTTSISETDEFNKIELTPEQETDRRIYQENSELFNRLYDEGFTLCAANKTHFLSGYAMTETWRKYVGCQVITETIYTRAADPIESGEQNTFYASQMNIFESGNVYPIGGELKILCRCCEQFVGMDNGYLKLMNSATDFKGYCDSCRAEIRRVEWEENSYLQSWQNEL